MPEHPPAAALPDAVSPESTPPEANDAPRKIIRPWRSRFRQEQHSADHASEAKQAPVLDHPLVPKGEAEWIATPEALLDLAARLRQAGSFVFDTEFIGEDCYLPRVCLLQIGTPDFLAIVDPLAVPDLRPIWDLVADPSIEKTVHAGSQDLAFPWRATGKAPANVFDTQIGAAFAGQPHSQGLGNMVRDLLAADVGGSAKFTKWDARPLTPLQRQYAANDVRYLPAVRALLAERLEKNGNAAFVRASCAEAFRAEIFTPPPPEQRLKIHALHRWTRPELGGLNALARWREELAVREDLPPRILLSDAVLAELVWRVLKEEPLDDIKGFPRPIRQAHLEGMVAVIQAGAKDLPPRLPRPKRMTEKQGLAAKAMAEALWAEMAATCAARQIDPASVCSRRELHRLACLRVANIAPEEPIRVTAGWRAELLGELSGAVAGGTSEEEAGKLPGKAQEEISGENFDELPDDDA